jgi:hypothetical protein
MAIGRHITSFAGLPVVNYPAGTSVEDPGAVAWRLEDPEYDGDGILKQRLDALLAEEWAGQVTALVIGNWGSAYDAAPPIDDLIAVATRLPALRALFLGEMTFEEARSPGSTTTSPRCSRPCRRLRYSPCVARRACRSPRSGTRHCAASPSSPAACPATWCAPSVTATCRP